VTRPAASARFPAVQAEEETGADERFRLGRDARRSVKRAEARATGGVGLGEPSF